MTSLPCSRRSLRWVLSAVQLLAFLGFAGTSVAADPELAPYSGQWARIVDDAAEEARLESIDTATGELSWLVRKMATGVLEKSTQPPGELTFFWDGDALRQRVRGPNGEFDRLVGVDTGPQRTRDPRGEETTIEWRRTAQGLEVHWSQEQAFGHNLYRVDEAGQTLLVEHRIQVTAIDGVDEIVYGSRFGRLAMPPVSSGPSAQPVSGHAVDLR
jgi:hypothetical protein